MSNPFTTPSETVSWQTLIDELVSAYSERKTIVSIGKGFGPSPYVATVGKNVQTKTYWATLQSFLETNCIYYIDHVNGPLNVANDEFVYFSLSTWRTIAGLNALGFRRSSDGVNFSYGQMQAEDIIGPWIFEDLQKGFSALKWTMIGWGNNNIGGQPNWVDWDAIEWIGTFYATSPSTAETNYANGDQWDTAFCIGAMSRWDASAGDYELGAGYVTGGHYNMYVGFPVNAPVTLGYIYCTSRKANTIWDTYSGDNRFDANGDAVLLNKINYIGQSAYTAGSLKSPIGDFGHRIAVRPNWPVGGLSETIQGWMASRAYTVYKWDFTYS